MRLFAQNGYERTTVTDIQRAAGLSAGSGALYKHYPSKEAVLQAAVEEYISRARDARAQLIARDGSTLETLEWIARRMLEILGATHDELRVLWRELHQYPALQARARREIMQGSYAAVADFLRESVRRGELREHDCEAVAAVIVGSLTMFRVFEALWGERTIAMDDERFFRTWYELVTRGLLLQPSKAHGKPSTRKQAQRTSRRRRRSAQ